MFAFITRWLKKTAPAEQKSDVKKEKVTRFIYNKERDASGQRTIAGVAFREFDEDGNFSDKKKLYAGSDVLTVFELSASIYWRNQIENGAVTKDLAERWLRELDEQSVANYAALFADPEKVDDYALTFALSNCSMHLLVSQADRLNYPDSILKWIRLERAKKRESVHHQRFVEGDNLKIILNHGGIDPVFASLLTKSVERSRKEAENKTENPTADRL